MKSSRWVGLCLTVWAACGTLRGQANLPYRADAAERTVKVWVIANPRGDIELVIETWNLRGVRLDNLRRVALPCDWRKSQDLGYVLEGTCRRYLESDGGLAHGWLDLGPLVRALRREGAQVVHLEWNDFGRPVGAAPPGWTVEPTDATQSLKSNAYRFVSGVEGQVPEAFEIRIGTAWAPSRMAPPFAVTLLGPLMVVLWLRRRAARSGAAKTGAAWLHWMSIGVWIYWDTSVVTADVAALAARMQVDSMFATLLIGSAIFTIPPLVSAAICMAVLAWTPHAAGRGAWRALIRGTVAREAAILVPFGIFNVGMGMFDQDWSTSLMGWPLAYLTYRALHWRVTRRSLGRVNELTKGELHESAMAMARRAGVKLNAVYVASSRSAQQATAFVSYSRSLTLTRGLVENFTRREVDALMGRELSYLRHGHIPTRGIAYWIYVVVGTPRPEKSGFGWRMPQLLLWIPILETAFILCCMLVSMYRERRGDARGAAVTGDAEGLAAALARFQKLACEPADWGGIQESVLSNPPVRGRILALAKKFGVDRKRALALIDDPDVLQADAVAGVTCDGLHYSLPPEDAWADKLYGPVDKAECAAWARWIGYLPLMAMGVLALEIAGWVSRAPSPVWWAGFWISLPLTGWLYVWTQDWLDRAFMTRLRRKMERKWPELAGGMFVGLLCGECASPDRFALGDVGVALLSGGYLEYRGGQSRFTLWHARVRKVSVWKGPPAWVRSYAVRIECDDRSFVVLRPERRASAREALDLERELNAWRRNAMAERPGAQNAVPVWGDEWPTVRSNYVGGLRTIPAALLRAGSICASIMILTPIEFWIALSAAYWTPFVATGASLFAASPRFVRWKRANAPGGAAAGQGEAAGLSEAPPAPMRQE